jgi:hypothetical protein
MYQLSQAVSTGTLKLIDWNSVVNAGMGGEVLQKALFETGKAMKTLSGVPMGQTFDEWKAAGNSFRGSLESGWVTAEVLTTTLKGFTGELTQAQLVQLGYTQEQAAEIEKLGQIGVDAATKVRTFTGLMQTTKESLASGWAESFKYVLGDFEEASTTFTGISNVVSKMLGDSADKRNDKLKAFSDLGGREDLILGLLSGFGTLVNVLKAVGEAFRDVFPAKSARELASMAKNFREFMDGLRPSEETLDRISTVFKGFFSILSIGWTVLKQTAKFIKDVFVALTGAGGGEFLKFAENIATFFIELQKSLVGGDAIVGFFDMLREKVGEIIDWFKGLDFGFEFPSLFGGKNGASKAGDDISTLTKIKDGLKDFADSIGNIAKKIGDGVATVVTALADFFTEVVSGAGDFASGDALKNIGLLLGGGGLAGIFMTLRRGLRFDFKGGIFEDLSDTLKSLTNTLEAMQTRIKAQALMYIAIGIGVLAASLLLLSMIDPANLAKALLAITVSFTQLIGAFAILNKIDTGLLAPVKMAALAVALGILAIAVLALAASAYLLGQLSWNELTKGLLGVTVLLSLLVAATEAIEPNVEGMFKAALALTGMAVAIGLLSIAVWAFSTMDWEQMVQGLLGVVGALTAVAVGMHLMPKDMAARSVGIFAIAGALLLLGLSVRLFASMDLGTMAMGFIGIATGLGAIGVGMRAFPEKMATTAGSLLVISFALVVLGYALKKMAELSLVEIGKGVLGISGTLFVLSKALTVMKKSTPAALSMLLVVFSLRALAGVLMTFANIPILDLVRGLLAIATVVGIFAAGAMLLQPALPAMFTLGLALAMIGAGFALFGLGASLFANAFLVIIDVASRGTEAIASALQTLLEVMPMVGQVFGAFLVALASGFISATPEIIGAVANLVSALLTAFTELLPKIGETANALIATLVGVLVESIPLIADAGYKLILGLLTAVQENIDDIVVAGVGIVVSFINGMAEAIPDYVEAVVGLITSFIDSISDNLDDILDSGVDLIVEFIEGLGENSQDIIDAGVDTVLDFIEGVGDNAVELANGAGQVILDLLIGLREAVDTYLPQIRNEGLKLIGAIIDGMTGGIAGKLGGLVKSLGGGLISGVKGFLGIFSPSREFMKIGEFVMLGLAAGVANDRPVISQIEKTSNSMLDKVSDTLAKIPDMVNNSSSFNPTITPVLDLTKFTTDAKAISNLLPTARVSAVQASGISQLLTAERELESVGAANVGPAVQFNQTINSPTALSAADIYRQTRNQINFAKEELNIP